MLNELHALERGLAAYGVATAPRHPDIKDIAKGDVIRVRLDESGQIAELDLLIARDRAVLWTLRDGQQNGFPGLKTGFREKGQAAATGLLGLSEVQRDEHGQIWSNAKSSEAKRAELVRLAEVASIDGRAGEWPRYRARLAERLLQLRALEGDPKTAAVPAAFGRFLRALDAAPGFLGDLLAALLSKVREDDEDWLEIANAALCEEVAIYVDVAREPAFQRDAGDLRQIASINEALQGAPRAADADGKADAVCALTGVSGQLLKGNFPQPNLPGLGQTYLFARNRDIPAMARYGRIGSASLPVDTVLVSRLSGAVTAVTAEERRGRTWRPLPAETGDKPDLLIAYVAARLDLPLAGALSADIEDDLGGEADLEAGTGQLLKLFDGIPAGAQPHDEARIFILRALDPANRKAIYDKRTTVGQVHEAAGVWARAMLNAPDWLGWRVFFKKKLVFAKVTAQPPLSLTALSRRLYIRGGRENTDAPGAASSEALALFLGDGDRPRRARRILKLLLERHTGLLSGLAHAETRDQLKDFDRTGAGRQNGLRSIAWMGALLHFLGRPKETYMDDTGFMLGQLLAAADVVHMGYCADVRGGDVPPMLIGNSVFAIAGRDPLRALDVLQTRWKPYGAWARRADQVRLRANVKSDSLAWAMRRGVSQARRAGQLCEDLYPQLKTLAGRPDERFRAELLLGYVAGLKPESKTSATSDTTGEEIA